MSASSPSPPKVLVVATHPIQYQVPLFQALAQQPEIDFSVLYMQLPDAKQQGVGFGVDFNWDIPLLKAYPSQVAETRGRGGLRGFFATRVVRPGVLLKRLDPDTVILTGWHSWTLLQVLIAARLQGRPVIMRGESNALRQRPWLTRMLHRLLLGRCAAFLAIGCANRAFYRGYGVPDGALFDTGYFVDNERFGASAATLAPRRDEFRANWKVPGDAVCFCYAGKLEPKKRILDLLGALQLAMTQSRQRIHLLVVGTGELMEQAQAFATQHQLPVTFAGFLNQTGIPAAYLAADALVLPSDYGETWGLVVNEAMACGRPAIVSDRVGCGPDLVSPGETGSIFRFGDINALAAAMVDMASDTDRLQSMGARARERVVRGYSVRNAVNGTLAAVRYVLRPT